MEVNDIYLKLNASFRVPGICTLVWIAHAFVLSSIHVESSPFTLLDVFNFQRGPRIIPWDLWFFYGTALSDGKYSIKDFPSKASLYPPWCPCCPVHHYKERLRVMFGSVSWMTVVSLTLSWLFSLLSFFSLWLKLSGILSWHLCCSV